MLDGRTIELEVDSSDTFEVIKSKITSDDNNNLFSQASIYKVNSH
jgi:hypothetical protein